VRLQSGVLEKKEQQELRQPCGVALPARISTAIV